jgi:hypothetical protein
MRFPHFPYTHLNAYCRVTKKRREEYAKASDQNISPVGAKRIERRTAAQLLHHGLVSLHLARVPRKRRTALRTSGALRGDGKRAEAQS